MSFPLLVTLLVFILIFFLRMPIAFGMLASAACYLLVKGADLSLVVNQVMNTYYTNYVIIAVPLFIFTANVMNTGKITDMIFKFAGGLTGRMRGALGHVNIIASLIFSGMTGSAIADAAGLGKIEIEAMKDDGYDPEFSCAITAASATIGPIFPPSIPLVIYAMLSSTSVGALFMGGMVPAVLLSLFLMIYVAIVAKKRNYPRGEKVVWKTFLAFTVRAIPALLTPIILLVGIYTGVTTPTEAGAIAGLYAMVISIFAYRAMGFKDLMNVIRDTIKDVGATSIMIGAAAIISYIVAREQLAANIGNWILGFTANKYTFLFLVNIVILILGMFMDTSTIQLVFVPIMIPVATALGIDMVHFGLVVTFNMMVGLSTPPFGMLLFITSGISGTPLKGVMKEILWPLTVMLIVLVIITYFPEVTLFLPKATGLM
ncbi:TRAP transporter large permease [Sphaerochaeta halotolerans]|jgi:tripartite ATP-independent transporter DctM subunit|uniref:TRAP transporter large permease n=1 Tax=Sphaerochaeta halotolerans TaxID=2293840 RepID=A0A372MIQ7_9SPIR|nr:TRAP transporter large permease [Sphaerochaeta halotolerans]RFU95634.1 TRAP transporter large permease [Sphaerochaeta halotolerans]